MAALSPQTTGGSAISADTTGRSFTTLTGPSYDGVDIPTGTIILNAPAGFVFNNDSDLPTLSIAHVAGPGPDAAGSITSVSASQIIVTITEAASNGTEDMLVWSNIEVRPAQGTPLAAGNIDETGTAALADVIAGAGGTDWGTLNEVPGADHELQFVQAPTDTTYGDLMNPAVTVEVLDQFGNLTDSTASIRLGVASGPSGATLSGGGPVAAVDGVATWSALTLNKVGSSYVLEASSGTLTTAISPPFAIDPRLITVTATPNTKVYDGTTTAAALPTITEGSLAFSDTADFTESYAAKNVGSGLALVPAGSVDDGNGGNNYLITFAGVNTGAITPVALSISAVTDTKVYDGTTSSSQSPKFQVTGLPANTLYQGDTFTSLSQAFESRNVLGTDDSTLAVSYAINDGDGGADYSVTTMTASGTINPASLAASIVGNPTKAYDGTTSATLTPANFSLTGLATGDSFTITQTSGTYNGKDVTNVNPVTASLAADNFAPVGGTLASNYVLPASATGQRCDHAGDCHGHDHRRSKQDL